MTAVEADRVEIQTGDGVSFALPLASPVSRFLALAVDWSAVTVAVWLLSIGIGFIPALPKDAKNTVMVLAYFVLAIGYGVTLEWFWGGRTLGKRAAGIRVADANGLRLTFSQVLIRNLLRAVDSLPLFYLVGGAVMITNSRLQRLGDLAAGTLVLRTRGGSFPQLPPGSGTRINSLKSYKALCARLRQRINPALGRVALEALKRRDQLEPKKRLELFAQMAAEFRRLVEFPEEVTEHLTDEQYLWNVMEILYERPTRVRGAADLLDA